MNAKAKTYLIPIAAAMIVAALAATRFTTAQQPSNAPVQEVVLPHAKPPESAQLPSPAAAAVTVPSTAAAPEVANNELRPIPGELLRKLDARIARAGDSVVVRTTEKATTASGIEIPKGSRLMGRVTDVHAQGRQGDDSRLAIEFDRAELTNGQALPIRSVIQSIGSAGAGTPLGGAPAADASHGAEVAGAIPAQSPVSPAPASDLAQPIGTIVARNGNIAIKTTAIPGVLLAGNVDGRPFSNASGALLGASRNVHLDGGTAMVVAIAAANSGPAGSR